MVIGTLAFSKAETEFFFVVVVVVAVVAIVVAGIELGSLQPSVLQH